MKVFFFFLLAVPQLLVRAQHVQTVSTMKPVMEEFQAELERKEKG
jgi:hypothetical protein